MLSDDVPPLRSTHAPHSSQVPPAIMRRAVAILHLLSTLQSPLAPDDDHVGKMTDSDIRKALGVKNADHRKALQW